MDLLVSKHLFNYQLNGVMKEEAEVVEDVMADAYAQNPELKAMKELYDSDKQDVDFNIAATMLRNLMPILRKKLDMDFTEGIHNCIHREFKVPFRDGNNFEIPVLVHTPISLVEENANAAIIYAHGGACVAGNAAMFKGAMSYLAIETGVVIFNVDYRLAPETKCPKNALDFYCTVKHIKENAKDLGIDPSRIAIAGENGGGYVCFAAMVMLAQKDEGHLVKLAIPDVPMISDYFFNDLESMTRKEQEAAAGVRKTWKCIANDLETQRNDPLLFPGGASDDILSKMPPIIIWENEFDISITEASRMAERLRTVGRLLEFRVQPGMTHASAWMPESKGMRENMRDYNLAIKEYLL